MKHWQKMLAAGLVCTAALGWNQTATEAAYQLNPEVKHATMALKQASEIGVHSRIWPIKMPLSS